MSASCREWRCREASDNGVWVKTGLRPKLGFLGLFLFFPILSHYAQGNWCHMRMGGRGCRLTSSHLARKEILWASAVYFLAPGVWSLKVMWLSESHAISPHSTPPRRVFIVRVAFLSSLITMSAMPAMSHEALITFTPCLWNFTRQLHKASRGLVLGSLNPPPLTLQVLCHCYVLHGINWPENKLTGFSGKKALPMQDEGQRETGLAGSLISTLLHGGLLKS